MGGPHDDSPLRDALSTHVLSRTQSSSLLGNTVVNRGDGLEIAYKVVKLTRSPSDFHLVHQSLFPANT